MTVADCVSESNAYLGIHPGSGSQRAAVRDCVARHNGSDGLYLCWRVRHGLFENNLLQANGGFGISIGHKDTDNLLRRNQLIDNLIENNGVGRAAAGIRVRGQTQDLLFKDNHIRDTRPADSRTQTVGIQLDELVGTVTLQDNQVEAQVPVRDQQHGNDHKNAHE